MKKLLSLLTIVFLAFVGISQNYFEKIILHDDNITRDAAMVIETPEHGFIVSCRSRYLYANDMLLSLSPEGEVTNSLAFQIDGKNMKYCGLFKDNERDDEYIAIAVLSSGNTTQSCIRNEIVVLHLDVNLEIKSHQICSLGENVINFVSGRRVMPRFVQEDDGNFFMAAHCQKTDGYCYLYLRMTLEGDIVKMEEDYSHDNADDVLMALFGRNKSEKNYGMIRLQNDGECILTGYHAKAPEYYTYYSYILKVDENGYDAVGENAESVAKPYFCYPNPAKDIIYIEFSPDVTCRTAEIYSMDGKLVKSQASNLETIDIFGLTSGVYVMKVRMSDGKEFSERIVKQ